ncbi:MAG: ABC transporter ATP-binding protein [Nocardioidaceae bacterium]|nr:ABC transporter ATP-binding protein [Nocardioidaceae bacterium]
MTISSTPSVYLDGITRTYRSKGGDVHAVRGVSHAFGRGTFTAIMGPSGSGKSTMLQIAAGLDRPTSGRVFIGDTDLGRLNETALTKLRRTSMGFVFQSYNLMGALTAYDNVVLPLRLTGQRVHRHAAREALARVGLADHVRRRPAELSGGQQQRVAIARALLTQPAVLFADEPTGALDRGTGREVLDLLRELTDDRGQTVVMVTHDPLAASYAHEVVFLDDGLVVGSLRGADAGRIAAEMNRLER